MDLDQRQANIKTALTCGICQNLLKNVTIIEECCHRFCKKCITKKMTVEKLHHCPVCNLYLGCTPLQKLRQDHQVQEIRDIISNKRRDYIERGLLQPKGKRESEATALTVAENSIAVPFVETSSASSSRTRKKERSLSSLADAAIAVAAAASPKQYAARGGRRKTSARRSVPPIRLAVVPTVAESEDMEVQAESVTVDPQLANEKKQAEPSKKQMANDPLEGMNELWKTLNSPKEKAGGEKDCVKGQDGTDPSDPASKGKAIIVDDDNTNRMNDETAAVSVAGKGKSKRRGRRKKAILPPADEVSNVPQQPVGQPSTAKTNPVINTPGIWFCLVPSDKQNRRTGLPPIPARYIMVKTVHMPVSFIRKYIARKLNLYSEDEVEISLLGQAIVGDEMTLQQLVALWCESRPKVETKVYVGSSAKDFLMTLSYACNSKPRQYT